MVGLFIPLNKDDVQAQPVGIEEQKVMPLIQIRPLKGKKIYIYTDTPTLV